MIINLLKLLLYFTHLTLSLPRERICTKFGRASLYIAVADEITTDRFLAIA